MGYAEAVNVYIPALRGFSFLPGICEKLMGIFLDDIPQPQLDQINKTTSPFVRTCRTLPPFLCVTYHTAMRTHCVMFSQQ